MKNQSADIQIMLPADTPSDQVLDAFIKMAADAPRLTREARWAANERRVRERFAGFTVEQMLARWKDPEHETDCDDMFTWLALHGAADGLI